MLPTLFSAEHNSSHYPEAEGLFESKPRVLSTLSFPAAVFPFVTVKRWLAFPSITDGNSTAELGRERRACCLPSSRPSAPGRRSRGLFRRVGKLPVRGAALGCTTQPHRRHGHRCVQGTRRLDAGAGMENEVERLIKGHGTCPGC